uniref:CCT-eta n=1 Tax=Ditylenchus dipsaci TaxID=166011 RepID=A0A915EHR2_9BILA
MSVPIILLREGTESKQGKGQILSNINACCAVADSVRTTLGPRGMDKLIVDRKGKTTISNDALTMCDIAKSQDAEVGDGTTTVVLLASDLQRRVCEGFGISQTTLVKISGEAELRSMLVKCASTTLSSKLVNQDRQHFAELVVDAVSYLDEDLPINMVGIKKVSGGSLTDSPKHYDKPLIAILNIELELKAERENAEMRISNVKDYTKIVNAEWTILYDKLQKIHDSGATIVLSKLPIGDVATQWFSDKGMFCAGRIPEEDLERVIAACGGSVLTTEQQVGSERFNFFTGCSKAHSCTILLRGGAEQFIAETERSLHDAIMIVRRAKKNDSIVAGGGAIEMELSRYIRELAIQISSKEQFFWKAYAKAFEVIPQQLCFNAGIDGINMLNKLRTSHQKGEKWAGVDVHKEEVADNMEGCVWEPALVKQNAIIAATEAACLVLSIDQTIKNPRMKNEMPGLPGQMPPQ